MADTRRIYYAHTSLTYSISADERYEEILYTPGFQPNSGQTSIINISLPRIYTEPTAAPCLKWRLDQNGSSR